MKAKQKENLLGKSRALIAGKKITSLTDFQDIPTEDFAQKSTDTPKTPPELDKAQQPVVLETKEEPTAFVRTSTYTDVHRRTRVAAKVVRENFRFTEELSTALEQYVADKRLKKNTVVEIALEHHLKHEGYL
jgi:hypothetical protein